jgi:hypothetical protein
MTNAILNTPTFLATCYVLGVGLLYAPKYVIGHTPPLHVSIVLGMFLVAGALILARLPRLARARAWLARHSLWILVIVVGLVVAAGAAYLVVQYERFVPWVDSPKLAQALWLTLQGRGIEPVLGLDPPGQMKVHPALLLFLPLYAVVPSHAVFLIARSILMASSAVLLFLIARRHLRADVALLIALGYLFNFTIVYHLTGGYYEFHLFPPLFFLACWFFERQQYLRWLSALFLLGGVREEVGFVLLGFSALAATQGRPRKWWLGALVLGVAWLVFAYEIVAGVSRGEYAYSRVFTGGAQGLGRVLNWTNGLYVYHIALPFLLILPFIGWCSLPVLPVFLGSLYVQYPLAKVAFLHYGIPVISGFSYATARHLARLSPPGNTPHADGLAVAVGLAMLALGLTQTVEHVSYEKSLHPPIGGTLGLSFAQESRVAQDPQVFDAWIGSLNGAIRMIPEGCRASVPQHVIAHLPHQTGMLDYNYERLDSLPDFILWDANVVYPDLRPREPAVRQFVSRHYASIYGRQGVSLYALAGRAATRRDCAARHHLGG